MNLIKIFILFFILQTPFAWAQQNNVKPQAPVNVSPANPGVNAPNKGASTTQDPRQAQGTPKKEKTEQILIDPFSGSASTASIDVNTNPDLANFVDQTLVGIIDGETKRIAILQSAQGQINRFKKNEKINSEYKILEIYKDKILVASLDNNEYEVYFNNVIKPVERKKAAPKKPAQLEKQLENSLDPNVDPLAPKLAPKKAAPVKKTAEPKINTNKTKKADPAIKENTAILDSELEELEEIKLIQEEEEKELKKSLSKTKNENIKKSNIKKQKEPIDDSYNPNEDPLNKSKMKKVSDIDVEKTKEKLKK